MWESLQSFRKVGVSKIFMHLWGITIFRHKFLSHSAENFCGHPFNVSEKLSYRQKLCIIGSITIICQNFFVSLCEKLCEHPLNLLENLGYRKIFMHNRGYHDFPSKYLCLTVTKNFLGIPSIFQKIWVIEKFYALMGYHNFPSKIFCLTVPKTFVVIPSMFQNSWDIEKLYAY